MGGQMAQCSEKKAAVFDENWSIVKNTSTQRE